MRIAVLAYPGVQLLDVIGPLDIFAEVNRQLGRRAYEPHVVGTRRGALLGSSGVQLVPHSTLATAPRRIDTLLVAGSPGAHALTDDPALTRWLLRRAPSVRRFGSVCSGAFVLAAAGLLEGCRATTHWEVADMLAQRYPSVVVEPDRIWVRDGRVFTSAGVTAGMDLALALVEEDFGREVALRVARQMVMFLKRPGGQSQFSAHLAAQAAERSPIQEAQAHVLASLAADLSNEALARRAGMSLRNFTRVFRREVGMSPADFVEAARLDAARRLVEDTSDPLKQIAAETGFSDVNLLRRAFLRRLGVTPSEYRERWRRSDRAR